jgi:hypothetical protein
MEAPASRSEESGPGLFLPVKARATERLIQPPLLMDVAGWTGSLPMIFIRVHPLPVASGNPVVNRTSSALA